MPTFSYTATDFSGAQLQGEVEAVDAEAAREALRLQEIIPIHIAESAAPMPLSASTGAPTQKIYLPIAATLRLYAGWLLAYYSIVYALGWYVHARPLPMEIPYVEGLMLSPLVLSFTLAAFLFLFGHAVYRVWGKGRMKGFIVSVAGTAVFLLYRMNVA